MTAHDRYEILETIASGDYAVVFRGVDHELHRDVAIKQIHQQYLADPRQLDRYWQEAHLLASLQHPHIMTIYDIVRERGWLILELMQGSMTQLLGGRPIDLKDLRLTLNYALQALQTMHRHGIVHGDIKPSNLLVDRNSRIKLGDFGIARRIAGEGSVTKGTTKYIAPEVVSDQFGEVGPHSDIYSLGFTAFELMCGSHFDSLFPGLNMFGRDKQIAWMMWHSAPDRRLPEIARVLEGVPPDLAFIIQRMTEKDPARRYRTTDEVLADLKLEGQVPQSAPTPEEVAAAAAKAKAARRKRSLVIAVSACSIVLSLGMLFFLPSGSSQPKPKPKSPTAVPALGDIVEVVAEHHRMFVKPENGEARPVSVRDGVDRVYLNGQQVKLADIDRRDRVRIVESTFNNNKFLIIEATRDAAQEAHGVVTAVDAGSALLGVSQTNPEPKEVQFLVSAQPLIEINGATSASNRPYQIGDLQKGDRVRLRYKSREDQRLEVAYVRALRYLNSKGRVAEVKDRQMKLRLDTATDVGAGPELLLPVAEDCVFRINGKSEDNGNPITLSQVRAGDRVTVDYDIAAHGIDIFRAVEIAGVVKARDLSARTMTIDSGGGATETFLITDATRMEIPGAQVTVPLVSLRAGDRVMVRRKSADPDMRDAELVTVSPQYDPHLWVLLVEQSDYAQDRIPDVPFVGKDAAAIHAALRFLYRVPENQCRRESNPTREKFQSAVGDMVRLVPADAQFIVCFLGRGYLDAKEPQAPYLATQDFDDQRPAETGVPLRWLLNSLEGSAAQEKLLILDTESAAGQAVGTAYPSAFVLAEAVRTRPNRPLSTSVVVLTSCGPNETAQTLPNDQRSVFGVALTAGLSGLGDEDQDGRLNAIELAKTITAESARLAGAAGSRQTPTLIPPDPTPPRLPDAAREAVLKLLDRLAQPSPDVSRSEYDEAKRLCGDQPDADVVYMLLVLKQDKSPPALEMAEKMMVEQATLYPAYEVASWIHGRRGNLRRSVTSLVQLFMRLPKDQEKGPDDAQRAYEQHVAMFAGRLAAFTLSAAPAEQQLKRADLAQLEQSLKQRGAETYAAFIEGGRAMRQASNELEQKISEAANPDEKKRLESQRSSFSFHVPFDYEAVRQYLADHADK